MVRSFGSLPNPVRSAYNTISEEVEKNPDLFIRRHLGGKVRQVRQRLAAHLVAHEDECVLVPNVTHGITLVLRSFPWVAGEDILIYTSTAFSQIKHNISAVGGLPAGPALSEFLLLFPETHTSILDRFAKHISTIKASATAKPPRIVAVFDTIVSTPGVLMPWKAMVNICRAEGVTSIVDAAHSLGQEAIVNLSEIQPDFWIGARHNFFFDSMVLLTLSIRTAASGSTPKEDLLFCMFHEGNGSFDVALALTINAALDFRERIGGEERIIDYCHNLALVGGRRVAEILGTEVMEMPEAPGELIGTMVNVLLPLPSALKPSPDVTRAFDHKLFEERKAYAISDFEDFANVMLVVCKELRDAFGDPV
ncbi:hypothetical protein DXG01_012955 [Tephrocybe rancida]|nr:hypothetical protein DXG01_012955 [Tephrocybe rancida]